MDNIWDRKFLEVGGHWPLWRGWKNRITTQNRQKSNAKKTKFVNLKVQLCYAIRMMISHINHIIKPCYWYDSCFSCCVNGQWSNQAVVVVSTRADKTDWSARDSTYQGLVGNFRISNDMLCWYIFFLICSFSFSFCLFKY